MKEFPFIRDCGKQSYLSIFYAGLNSRNETKTGWKSCGLQMMKICDCWKKTFCFGKKMMKKSCARGMYTVKKMNSWSWNNF